MRSNYQDVRVGADAAHDAAEEFAATIADAVGVAGVARVAVSGGSTAPELFRALAESDAPLERTEVWQVDERVAPDGDAARNLAQLQPYPWTVHAMPVTDLDLAGAARRYAAALPRRFDLVHLGVGDDGHTASWPPGDARLAAWATGTDVDVAVARAFHGHDRMTITPPVVQRAARRLVLVVGGSKASVVHRWTSGDAALPASLIPTRGTVVFLDTAAAALLTHG